MEFERIKAPSDTATIRRLGAPGYEAQALLGDNRELMRHSNGALHAVVTQNGTKGGALSLYGAAEFGGELRALAEAFVSVDGGSCSEPATDSNQNGAYVAFVQGKPGALAGYVAHFADPFGDPSDVRVSGPLTPEGDVRNSFLQASRAFNSVVYGWRDGRTGTVYAGVSQDGIEFPPAEALSGDIAAIHGPAIGIHGDYVVCIYQSEDDRFAPVDAPTGSYYVWTESGDGGRTWSDPLPLFPSARDLPPAVGLASVAGDDLRRYEVPVLGDASPAEVAAQLLVWANLEDASDSRVFAMTTLTAPPHRVAGADWPKSVGLIAFKSFGVGGEWDYSITNRSLYRRSGIADSYNGRVGRHFKYSALPGTRVRVVSYVDHAPDGSGLEDLVAILVSTNKGDSFDYETTFTASELGFDPHAELVISNSACAYADADGMIWQDLLIGDASDPQAVRHATLPIGMRVDGVDPTLAW